MNYHYNIYKKSCSTKLKVFVEKSIYKVFHTGHTYNLIIYIDMQMYTRDLDVYYE